MQTTSHRTTVTRLVAMGAAALLLAGCASGSSTPAEPATSPEPSPTTSADGASASVGDLDLTGFWVKESSLDLAAGFGTITNTGDQDDALVSFTAAGIPTTEIHTTTDGVMSQVPELAVPAGGSAVLAPMGDHLMLIGITEPLTPGMTVPLDLTFASGATVTVDAPVRAFTGDTGHADGDMGGHSHSDGDSHGGDS